MHTTQAVFVSRERELSQLQGFLERALAGQGQVCFITGEAGTGKTALATEFARQAQRDNPELLVAVGECNAQTGIGDPYLPFREILALLTGDVETKLAQGAITQENANRLRDFLSVSGQAILEYGPDLIDIFVPGAGLAARIGSRVAERAGWLDRLETLTEDTDRASAGQDTGLDQGRIFEQYTHLLHALSAQQPLMLIVDDLQWSDAASAALLFHLGRRIDDSRIFVVGTYRPNDVALGRDGQRHPLEPLLNEFKRYRGDVWIDLGQQREAEGRQFVDALVDSEPNRLDEGFREALYRHTDGHPLFTVELLRNLKERGDLVRDADGRWCVGPALDWETLPPRVEGVIEERIGRLEADLRETLTVASVEGEKFTAEVIAKIRSVSARDMVRRLSGELEKRHHLIGSRGMDRAGRQRLSLYQFLHSLFQKYLYNNLDEAERAYLHEDVGYALEDLYGDRVDEIAVQLARHFLEAGLDDKALEYLIEAGDRAFRQYANTEAVGHYTRAIEIARHDGAPSDQLEHLYLRRGRALEVSAQFDASLENYAEMKTLARARGDRRLELAAVMAQAILRSVPGPTYAPERGQVLSEQALALARDLGNREAEAKILWALMLLHLYAESVPDKAMTFGERSLAIARELDLDEQLAFTLNDLADPYWQTGQLSRALELREEARELWRDLGNLPMLTDNLSRSAMVHLLAGEYDQVIAVSDEAYAVSESIDQVWGQANSRLWIGYVYLERGQTGQAIEIMEEALRLGEQVQLVGALIFTQADLGWVYGMLGAPQRGMALVEAATATAQEAYPNLLPWPMAQLARLHVLSRNLDEAADAVQACYRDIELADMFYLAPVWVVLADAELALAEGDPARAITVLDRLLTHMRDHRWKAFVSDALYLKGEALLSQGHIDEARTVLNDARREAEALGSRRSLWPILSSLSQVAAGQGDSDAADELRSAAMQIVNYIADHIGSAELRTSFLNSPQVRRISPQGD